MNYFERGDEQISDKEIMIAIPSVVIGTGILSLPKSLANQTGAGDGWVSILLTGLIMLLVTWVIAKFVSKFKQQSFLEYTTRIIGRKLAIGVTIVFVVSIMGAAAYQIRAIANIAKEYLFDQTPIEVIALLFFLIVIYAVSGSREALFRLNMLFFPIILVVTLIVCIFSVKAFDLGNLLPVFETDWKGYSKGMTSSVQPFLGFSILWFYMILVKDPAKVPKMAVAGMAIPIVAYILLYIFVIGVFGNSITGNLIYPTVELAKNASIPGEFLERFESVFFVIWVMAIFNSVTMLFDSGLFALNSVFKRRSKFTIILITSPIVFFTAMVPEEMNDVSLVSDVITYALLSYSFFVGFLLITVAKIRGVI